MPASCPAVSWAEALAGASTAMDLVACPDLPRTVTLLGKGPSLDRWRPDPIDPGLVAAVNEAALFSPAVSVAFALDFPVLEVLGRRGETPEARYRVVTSEPLAVQYVPAPIALPFLWSARGFPGLIHRSSTAALAVEILGAWGARRIRMVGFDALFGGAAGYSTAIRTRPRDSSAPPWSEVNRAIRAAAASADVVLDRG